MKNNNLSHTARNISVFLNYKSLRLAKIWFTIITGSGSLTTAERT
ncbi:MAG TPA: hypothetical protein PLS78_03695 [bacterium]|nr:hypothetical protein [bacterium]